MRSNEPIKWAPRLQPVLLERLYRADAKGVQDIELCDQVAYKLYLRNRSILMVSRDQVTCPRCEHDFQIDTAAPETISTCPTAGCGWQTDRRGYQQSWSKKRLWAANALPAFEAYEQKYSPLLKYREKMLLIDRLIHSFHWSMKEQMPARSAANNLFEGSHDQVVMFLDSLTAQDLGAKSAWRKTVDAMTARRKRK